MSEDHYAVAVRAIEEAEDEDEVHSAYMQYDATEGAVIRRSQKLNDRLREMDEERDRIEGELNKMSVPSGFRYRPIKDIAAVKIFDMLYITEAPDERNT